MSFKPGDFLFGIVEFLAFIVPGMILYVTLPDVISWNPPQILSIKHDEMSTGNWIVFILAAYILGHFIHHISALMFNRLYEVSYYKRKRIKHFAFLESIEAEIKKVNPEHKDLVRIAEAYIRCEQPLVVSELEKTEANSKLFRALALLSLYLCFYPGSSIWIRVAFIVICALSFHKFGHQRWTHRLLCYEYFWIIKGNKAGSGKGS